MENEGAGDRKDPLSKESWAAGERTPNPRLLPVLTGPGTGVL